MLDQSLASIFLVNSRTVNFLPFRGLGRRWFFALKTRSQKGKLSIFLILRVPAFTQCMTEWKIFSTLVLPIPHLTCCRAMSSESDRYGSDWSYCRLAVDSLNGERNLKFAQADTPLISRKRFFLNSAMSSRVSWTFDILRKEAWWDESFWGFS